MFSEPWDDRRVNAQHVVSVFMPGYFDDPPPSRMIQPVIGECCSVKAEYLGGGTGDVEMQFQAITMMPLPSDYSLPKFPRRRE